MAKQKSGLPGRKPTSDAWLSYVAGFLDGEGCFYFNGTPEVSVTNTFPYTLHKLQEAFGGSVSERTQQPGDPSRTCYQWRVCGDSAIALVRLVHGHLWEKAPQADLLLRIRKTTPGPRREGLIRQLKQLKRIDYETGGRRDG